MAGNQIGTVSTVVMWEVGAFILKIIRRLKQSRTHFIHAGSNQKVETDIKHIC